MPVTAGCRMTYLIFENELIRYFANESGSYGH
jgi:hypothetical protein